MTKQRSSKYLYLLALLPFLVVALLYEILPLATVVYKSFLPDTGGAFTLENYQTIASKLLYRKAITNSLKISITSAFVGIIIAFFGARAAHERPGKLNRAFTAILNMVSNFAGIPLAFFQEEVPMAGAAIECRINAASCGTLRMLHVPGGPSVRFDTCLVQGTAISPYYDSLVGKLIVYAKTREETLRKLRAALCELVIDGIPTNIEEQLRIVEDERFSTGRYDLTFMGNR